MPGDFDLDKWEKCGINIADGNHAPICDLPKYSDCAGGLFPHKRFRMQGRPRFTAGGLVKNVSYNKPFMSPDGDTLMGKSFVHEMVSMLGRCKLLFCNDVMNNQ